MEKFIHNNFRRGKNGGKFIETINKIIKGIGETVYHKEFLLFP